MRAKLGTALLLVCVAAVSAQAGDQIFSYAIKVGMNIANLNMEPEPPGTPQDVLRYGGGLTLGFNVSETLSIDGDFLFMRTGTRAEWGSAGCDTTYDWNLDYFIFNPMVRYRVKEDGLTPFFVAGLEVGFLVRVKETFTVQCAGESVEKSEYPKTRYEYLDYGLNLGLGLEIPVKSNALTLEGRYALGFPNIRKDFGPDDLLPKYEASTRGIYVLAGYRF